MLGQLVVTPEVVVGKINNMKDLTVVMIDRRRLVETAKT